MAITPNWLSESLGLGVRGIKIRQVILGTATKILADLEYSVDSAVQAKSSSHPKAICIKGGFERNLFALGMASAYLREVGAVLFTSEYWDSHLNSGQAPSGVPDYLRDRCRVHAAFKKMWGEEKSDTRLRCILHGDAHIGNTYFQSDGGPALLDYQAVHIGSAMHDIAYWIGGSLSIEDRRVHKRELLDTYLQALHAKGAPLFHRVEVWEDYSKHMLHGFLWVITGTAM